MEKPKVIVIGLGYIGLPAAALIAKRKIKVVGVDVDQEIVDLINRGEVHIVEPELEGLVRNVVENGFLTATAEPSEGDVFLIAVQTPLKDGSIPDISFVEKAIKMIIPLLREENLIIIESTIPIGTTNNITEMIYSKRPELREKIYVAYCPERVLPGQIIHELEFNDRVIGGIDCISAQRASDFYQKFVKSNLHKTDAITAEMCKLVENAYRDVNIAFSNELSIIAEKANIDVWDLINLANKHPRVNILKPGPGVGGHCIALDPWFIISDFKKESRLIRTAREVNTYKKNWVLNKIRKKISQFEATNGKKATIACMGLTYKSDINDLRESPSLNITERLVDEGIDVLAVEPNISKLDRFNLINYEDAIARADIIVFLVAHREFKNISIDDNKIILDFCGINR